MSNQLANKVAKSEIAHVPGGYSAEAKVAAELNLSLRTLRKWRAEGRGPAFTKIGRRVFYRDASRDAWLRAREVQPVREA